MDELKILMREYVRVTDMCNRYNRDAEIPVKSWQCVRVLGRPQQSIPDFYAYPIEEYDFAIDIRDGKPLFHAESLEE